MKGKNYNFDLTVFNLIKEGKNPSQISKDLSISKQKVNYYIRRLKKEGLIVKIGYGVWEVRQEVKTHLKHTTPLNKKSVRGHAFIWTIKIPEKLDINWIERLNKLGIDYKLVGKERFPRVFINNKKIWLGKKNIVIYEPQSFYAEDAINSRKYATISMLETLEKLESKLVLNLKPYIFKPAREHYGLFKNDLAIQCNRNKEKIHIRDDLEGEWLWIDDSLEVGELETGGVKALVRNKQVQNWWNDQKKHNFEVTSTFLITNLNSLIEDRRYWAKHQRSHVKAIQTLSSSVKQLQKEIRRLKDANVEKR